MEYLNTGVSEMQIGMPTEEERKWLEKHDYVLFSKGKKAYEPFEEYEIWLKAAKYLRGGTTCKPLVITEERVVSDDQRRSY